MPEYATAVRDLQAVWDEAFPMAAAMGVTIVDYDGETLKTKAPLRGNTNVHGSAFAGSLYALEALTAWGAIYLKLAALELDASIVHASGSIDFARPINADIVATSTLNDSVPLERDLREKGRSRFELTTTVAVDGEPASTFSGVYVVRAAP